MVIAVARIVLALHGNDSLKGKRKVVRRVVDRVRHRFNVAIAEVAEMDVHRRAVLGMAAVSNSGSHASSMIDAVIQQVQASTDAPLVERSLEIVHIGDGEHMEKLAGLGAVPDVGLAADWDLDAEEAWLKAGDDDGEH